MLYRRIAILAMCVLGGMFAPTAMAAPPTLAELAARPSFGQVSLSPDGRHLAVARLAERGTSLLIVDTDTLQPTTELTFETNAHVLGFHWANSEVLVVNRGQRFSGRNGPANTGELYAVAWDGSKRRYLFGGRADRSRRDKGRSGDRGAAWVVDGLPADPARVLIIDYAFTGRFTLEDKPTLRLVDVNSGARQEVAAVPLNRPWITTDNAGQVRFAFGVDDELRTQTLRFDPANASWQPVDLGLGRHGSLRPLQFTPDNAAFYATISEVGEPGCLYLVQAADYARTQLTCEKDAELDQLMPSSRPGVPLAALYSATGMRAHLLDATLPEATLFRTLAQQFAPASVRFERFSDDGKRLLFHVSGDREPGSVYLYDADRKESRLVFASHASLSSDQLGPTLPFAFDARDSTPLHGFVTFPPGVPAQGLPLIVMPHGGPYGVADDWKFDPDAQLLATRGYAVLKVNFRGSGGHGELFERKGYQQWGGAIQDDIVDATRWAIAQGLADPNRICIVGGSFGAYSALMSAIREPDLFRCAVGIAGVYDLELMFNRGDVKRTALGRAYLAEVLGTDEDALRAQSPSAQADRLKAEVLLVHGDADARAPLAHAKELVAALKSSGKAHQLVVLDNEGHGFFLARNREAYYRTLLEFVGRHLGAAAATSAPP